MRWILAGIGLAAAGLAVAVVLWWNRRSSGVGGEVSVVAAVEGKDEPADGQTRMRFVDLNGRHYQFAVPAAIAWELEAPQQGVLTFRKGQFVYFLPREALTAQGGSVLRVS